MGRIIFIQFLFQLQLQLQLEDALNLKIFFLSLFLHLSFTSSNMDLTRLLSFKTRFTYCHYFILHAQSLLSLATTNDLAARKSSPREAQKLPVAGKVELSVSELRHGRILNMHWPPRSRPQIGPVTSPMEINSNSWPRPIELHHTLGVRWH